MKFFRRLETPQDTLVSTPEAPAPFLTVNAAQKETTGRLRGLFNSRQPNIGVTTEDNRIEIRTSGLNGPNVISVRSPEERDVCMSLLGDINTCITTVENLPFKKKSRFAADLKEAFARACGQASDAEGNFGGMLAAEFIQGVQQVARGTNSVFARYTADALDEIGAATAGDQALTRESWELGEKCAKLVSKNDSSVREWIAMLSSLQDLKHRADEGIVPLKQAA